ncbi:MAG: sulfatase-like hydrolase/transferase [Betaproteobacteria bacterium]|nr:sulfatase-like hydrolase/transferase [Betaproteobacteria bacterium]
MRPSFVFILADDLGHADLGCYGGRSPSCSPALDRMAAQGLRFTNAYANSPVCSPTRFALMTGRYQYRLRGAAEEPISGKTRGSAELGLSPSHPTLPSLLRAAGYATALVGKWHLGFPPHFSPLRSGYEEFFGVYHGAADYFTHCDPQGLHDLFEGEQEVHRTGYLTDLLSERAVSFVERKKGKPFLLSLHYTAPHWPWETRDDEAEARRIGGIRNGLYHLDGGSVQTYRKMISHMDEGIGAVLDALRRTGADENTLVVFTSDNGGERFSDNWPLVGGKMDLLEGGIRVPLMARWPARIAAGKVTDRLAITMDWTSTFLAAAGVPAHAQYPLDGEDLLREETSERQLFWRMKYRSQKAVRTGRYKYLSLEGNEFLFDVVTDARERANLARREPERLASLRERYRAWEATMPPIPADAAVSLVYNPKTMALP